MKLLKHLFSSFILLQLLFSCTTTVEKEKEVVISMGEPASIEPTFIDTLLGEGGVIRGVDFGLSVAEIRGIELAHHDETNLDSNGVTMVRFAEEFSLAKGMDVEYYFSDKNGLNKVVLVIYCENKEQQEFVYSGVDEIISKKEDLMYSILKTGDEHNFNVELVIEGGLIN